MRNYQSDGSSRQVYDFSYNTCIVRPLGSIAQYQFEDHSAPLGKDAPES